ncbi:hypothetical protein ABZ922_28795 [Streptomyces shenzhenensis]|uniref:hypothetical protein n=1 Tax=Streptomyces shenzhenensis TaxID=943815 RepID=UPI0033FA88C1
MEMTKRRPRASFTLWVGSHLALIWAMVVHLVDRVLLFLTPTPRERPARHSALALAALTALLASRGTREAAHRNN